MTVGKHVRGSGIAITFDGVRYRSLLEARYGALWKILGIAFDYEPDVRLRGYIPDFILDTQLYSSPQVPGPVLVECRPVVHDSEFHDVIAKVARSGWRGSAIVAGAAMFPQRSPWGVETPFGRAYPAVDAKHVNDSSSWYPVGWYAEHRQFGMGGDDLTMAWREAGRRTQWMPQRT